MGIPNYGRESYWWESYNMVYGNEAIILAKIIEESAWVSTYEPINNETQWRVELDLVGEKHEGAWVHMEAYQ